MTPCSWVPFENPAYNILPSTTGLYRVRAIGRNDIFYIGQTGRSLRERLRGLIRNTMKDPLLMPYNDPHTAAPSLWAWRDAEGLNFECSATPITCSDNERKAIECYLLWQYRLERGRSTVCNHGHFHPLYSKSKNGSTRYRGSRLSAGNIYAISGSSLPPLHENAVPLEPTWMQLSWSNKYHLHITNLQNIPTSPGVYKIFDADTSEMLYIGESESLRKRFRDHYQKVWDCLNPIFSFYELPNTTTLSYHLLEIENDLIGAYYHQTKVVPNSSLKTIIQQLPATPTKMTVNERKRRKGKSGNNKLVSYL